VRRCDFECSHLHCGGPLGIGYTRAFDRWYCTHHDAEKQALPDDCHDAREGMLLDPFVWGQPCVVNDRIAPRLFKEAADG
jgi:hypothetical protein